MARTIRRSCAENRLAAPRLQPVADPEHLDFERVAPVLRLLEELEVGPDLTLSGRRAGSTGSNRLWGKKSSRSRRKTPDEQLGHGGRIAQTQRRRRSGRNRSGMGRIVIVMAPP